MRESPFNLRIEFEQGPLSNEMTRRVLTWGGVNPQNVGEQMASAMLDLVTDGATAQDFCKWCRSKDAPPALQHLNQKWMHLLFDSVALHIYSHHQRTQNLAISHLRGIWSYSCMTVYCEPHSTLDGFEAAAGDPIWHQIHPPNGWLCGCSVMSLGPDEIGQSATEQPSLELRRKCLSWIAERPDRIYKLL